MQCGVPGCDLDAKFRVILYDFYGNVGATEVFFQTDHTCQFICAHHAIENEERASGERRPRGGVNYPFTNLEGAQGFTIYQPVDWPAPPQDEH